MKLLKTGIFLTVLGLLGCVDSIDEFKPDVGGLVEVPETETGDIVALFEDMEKDRLRETFFIDAGQESMFLTKRSTRIDIPANAFVNAQTGELVTGQVDIEVLELSSKGEILLYGKATESYGTLLESGGEFFIAASQDNQQLKLSKGSKIRLRVLADNPNPRMELWYLATDETNPFLSPNQETWDDADNDPNRWDNVQVSEWLLGDTIQFGGDFGVGYDCFSDSLRWINIDVFMDLPPEDVTDVCVDVPTGFSNINTRVFLVFNDLNSVIVLPGNPEEKLFCNFYSATNKVGVPLGASVTFVAIAKKEDGCLFFGISNTFIEENHLEELEMNKSTLEEIKDIIMGL